MKILISGFEPFDGWPSNPSEKLMEVLAQQDWGFDLITVVLPVSFQRAFAILQQEVQRHQPQFVVAFGLAQSRTEITPERLAINLMDASIADNEGFQPQDLKISNHGPDGRFSALPLKKMVSAIQRSGASASISNTAGTYVCNRLMYELLQTHPRSGFVHLPPENHMNLATMALGVTALLEVLAEDR